MLLHFLDRKGGSERQTGEMTSICNREDLLTDWVQEEEVVHALRLSTEWSIETLPRAVSASRQMGRILTSVAEW